MNPVMILLGTFLYLAFAPTKEAETEQEEAPEPRKERRRRKRRTSVRRESVEPITPLPTELAEPPTAAEVPTDPDSSAGSEPEKQTDEPNSPEDGE